jgi:hypothetical protein
MNATALTNRHPVDELAEVRAKIKFLGERESELKAIISKLMGPNNNSLGGDEWIAIQSMSERKGGIDEKKLIAAGIDVEKFRKPGSTPMIMRVERREVEAAE